MIRRRAARCFPTDARVARSKALPMNIKRAAWVMALWVMALMAPVCVLAQVQTPANQVPIGEGRLPTEGAAPAQGRPGGDDCRRQSQVVREQFAIQEQSVRREMNERSRQASAGERERLRLEMEQRLVALRAESTEAERKVMAACRG